MADDWLSKFRDIAEHKPQEKPSSSNLHGDSAHKDEIEHLKQAKASDLVQRRQAFISSTPRGIKVSGLFGRPELTELTASGEKITHIKEAQLLANESGNSRPRPLADSEKQLDPKKDTPEKAAHEKPAHEKAAHEKAAHEKAAHEKAAHEKAAREKAEHEKPAHEKPASAGDTTVQKHGPLHDVVVLVDDMLQKNNKIDENLVGPKWSKIDMAHDSFSANQILKDKDVLSYNCKYYLKTYIEGHEPKVASSINCELEPDYLQKHGYEQTKTSVNDLKPGDVVVVKAGAGHLAGVEHVAIVVRDEQGHLCLMQKPDSVHRVQKCSPQDFEQAYGSIDSGNVEVYRHK